MISKKPLPKHLPKFGSVTNDDGSVHPLMLQWSLDHKQLLYGNAWASYSFVESDQGVPHLIEAHGPLVTAPFTAPKVLGPGTKEEFKDHLVKEFGSWVLEL
jgi:hypothetical protein